VEAAAAEVEKLDVNDEELKKELEAMKKEGLIDEEEIAELVSGKVRTSCARARAWCVRARVRVMRMNLVRVCVCACVHVHCT
jgi:hypothetical protein